MSIGRHTWQCWLPAKIVREAAEKKVAYHTERIDFWTGELEKANFNHASECRVKLSDHQKLVTDFSSYVRLIQFIEQGIPFVDAKNVVVSLDLKDILYFDIPSPNLED